MSGGMEGLLNRPGPDGVGAPRRAASAFDYAATAPRRSGEAASSPPPAAQVVSKTGGDAPCSICWGRKADALRHVRGLERCPFCKRDLTKVDVSAEASSLGESFPCPACQKTFSVKADMLQHLLAKCQH